MHRTHTAFGLAAGAPFVAVAAVVPYQLPWTLGAPLVLAYSILVPVGVLVPFDYRQRAGSVGRAFHLAALIALVSYPILAVVVVTRFLDIMPF